jgi:hypothetical protein
MMNEANDNAPIAKTKNEGIDRVLAIGSGKGGVGKKLCHRPVSCSLAATRI